MIKGSFPYSLLAVAILPFLVEDIKKKGVAKRLRFFLIKTIDECGADRV